MAKKRAGRKGTRVRARGEAMRWARVVVKFHDFVDLPYVDGVEREIKKRKLAPWEALVRQIPAITLSRSSSPTSGSRASRT